MTAQRFFSSGSSCSELRTLHSNASFLLIWRLYRNRSSVECLARQIGAYPSGFIASALEQSWSRDRYQPLGLQISNQFLLDDQLRCVSGKLLYLLIIHESTHDSFILGLLPSQDLIVYLPNNRK